jgi:hypothetical protein
MVKVEAIALRFSVLLSAILLLFRDYIFPPYFSSDSHVIRVVAKSICSGATKFKFTAGSAYTNTSYGFCILGLSEHRFLLSFLPWAVVVFCIVFWRTQYKHRGLIVPTATQVFFECFAILMAAVYFGTYSKEFFQFFFVTIAVVIFGRLGTLGLIGISISIIAYAHIFRTYWYIILAVYLLMYLLLRKGISFRRMLFGIILSTIILSFVLVVIYAFDTATNARVSVNRFRDSDTEANQTLIPQLFDNSTYGNIVASVFNMLSAQIMFLIPIPVLRHLSVYHILVFLMLIAMVISYIIILRRIQGSTSPIARHGVSIILAFFVGQSLFEPDFGSFLRHNTPMFLIAVSLLYEGFSVNNKVILEREKENGHSFIRYSTA